MIISYRYQFIFVRTRKTASSTIEEVLRENLGPEDMLVSQKQLVYGQSFEPVERQAAGLAGHMLLQQIKPLVSPQFWESCFKFSCERHPYEKAVSLAHYNYGRKGPRDTPFQKYLDKIVRVGNYRGFGHYSINGQVAVNDFIRFESLYDDLQRICTALGIAVPAELPRRKTTHRTDRRPAVEILSEEQKDIVYETCREEFDLFGYPR